MRLAIALSGGGFRATFFHLGMIRFLRDAGLLQDVTDVSSVSGGSILATHMLLHWENYGDKDDDVFRDITKDLVQFGQRDIRGKILRRLPLCLLSKLLPFYKQSRSLLLERFYRKYLYEDARLASLSGKGPRLHVMTTNLTTGESCSFNRSGLTVDRPRQDFKGSDMSLAKAVTCSSAFPGFFPPIPISAEMLGIGKKRWIPETQIFTDGGVYDNLGVRKLKLIDEVADQEIHFTEMTVVSWVELCKRIQAQCEALSVPASAIYKALSDKGRELVQLIAEREDAHQADVQKLVGELNRVLGVRSLYDESAWCEISLQANLGKLLEKDPSKLSQQDLEAKNRALIESAFPDLFRIGDIPFDLVIVSDAGAPFDWETGRFEGLVSTALRAISLLTNRIHTSERSDRFVRSDRCLVLNIDDAEEDPTLSAAVRGRLRWIRTDLDNFSDEEIRALVMHGYCVARDSLKELREAREKIDVEVFEKEPWDPLPANSSVDLSSAGASGHFRESHRRKAAGKTVATYLMLMLLALSALGFVRNSGWLDKAWSLTARQSLHVERQVVYARLVSFSDRESDPEGAVRRRVGQEGTAFASEERNVYDEARYTEYFQLKSHRVDKMTLDNDSSGIVAATAIIPHELEFDAGFLENYDRGKKSGSLEYDIPLKEPDGKFLEYVAFSINFYNGYQFNRGQNRWESDGGAHIHYPTDEFVMIFDFRTIDYEGLLAGPPVLKVKRGKGEAKEIPGAHFRKGVLHSPVIRNLQEGDGVHVDWKWGVE